MQNLGLTEQDFHKESEIENQFALVETLKDHRFGDIALLTSNQNPGILIMRKEKFSQDENECCKDILEAKQRQKMQHPNILQMPDFSTRLIKNEQGQEEMLVSGYYEYPEWDLEREIEKRAQSQEFFHPDILMKIIFEVLEAMAFLQSKKMIHGDLRPKYISFSNNFELPFQLCDRLGDPYPPNKVQIDNIKKSKNIYMSPILFKSLSLKKKRIRHNPYKSEAFSLGMVALEAGILDSVQNVYDKQAKQINVEELLRLIELFMEKYGDHDLLRETLIWLLDLNGHNRKDPKTLVEQIQKFAMELNGEMQPEEQEIQNQQQNQVEVINSNSVYIDQQENPQEVEIQEDLQQNELQYDAQDQHQKDENEFSKLRKERKRVIDENQFEKLELNDNQDQQNNYQQQQEVNQSGEKIIFENVPLYENYNIQNSQTNYPQINVQMEINHEADSEELKDVEDRIEWKDDTDQQNRKQFEENQLEYLDQDESQDLENDLIQPKRIKNQEQDKQSYNYESDQMIVNNHESEIQNIQKIQAQENFHQQNQQENDIQNQNLDNQKMDQQQNEYLEQQKLQQNQKQHFSSEQINYQNINEANQQFQNEKIDYQNQNYERQPVQIKQINHQNQSYSTQQFQNYDVINQNQNYEKQPIQNQQINYANYSQEKQPLQNYQNQYQNQQVQQQPLQNQEIHYENQQLNQKPLQNQEIQYQSQKLDQKSAQTYKVHHQQYAFQDIKDPKIISQKIETENSEKILNDQSYQKQQQIKEMLILNNQQLQQEQFLDKQQDQEFIRESFHKKMNLQNQQGNNLQQNQNFTVQNDKHRLYSQQEYYQKRELNNPNINHLNKDPIRVYQRNQNLSINDTTQNNSENVSQNPSYQNQYSMNKDLMKFTENSNSSYQKIKNEFEPQQILQRENQIQNLVTQPGQNVQIQQNFEIKNIYKQQENQEIEHKPKRRTVKAKSNYPFNDPRQSHQSITEKQSRGSNSIKREYYVSPGRFREFKESISREPQKQVSIDNTYDYQIQKQGDNNVRKVLLSRHNESIFKEIAQGTYPEVQSIYNQPNLETDWKKRYGQDIEVVQKKKNYQVFRLSHSNKESGPKGSLKNESKNYQFQLNLQNEFFRLD